MNKKHSKATAPPNPVDSEPWLTRYTVLSSPPTCKIKGLLLAEALEDAACHLQGRATKVVITVEPNASHSRDNQGL